MTQSAITSAPTLTASGPRVDFAVTREELEGLIRPTIGRTIDLCRKILDRNDLAASDSEAARKQIKLRDRDYTLAFASGDMNHGVRRRERNILIGRVACYALVACADNGHYPIVPVYGGTV